MVSVQQTSFNIDSVPTNANKDQVSNNLVSGNLLSIGQYCDSDCSAHFFWKTSKNQAELLCRMCYVFVSCAASWLRCCAVCFCLKHPGAMVGAIYHHVHSWER